MGGSGLKCCIGGFSGGGVKSNFWQKNPNPAGFGLFCHFSGTRWVQLPAGRTFLHGVGSYQCAHTVSTAHGYETVGGWRILQSLYQSPLTQNCIQACFPFFEKGLAAIPGCCFHASMRTTERKMFRPGSSSPQPTQGTVNPRRRYSGQALGGQAPLGVSGEFVWETP